ncbi:glycosyl hydrolase-related protein [Curtobacterium flaccumfaciens pv. flaccumfaciens]
MSQVDLLERPLERSWSAGEPVVLTLRPFEIVTLRVRRA